MQYASAVQSQCESVQNIPCRFENTFKITSKYELNKNKQTDILSHPFKRFKLTFQNSNEHF